MSLSLAVFAASIVAPALAIPLPSPVLYPTNIEITGGRFTDVHGNYHQVNADNLNINTGNVRDEYTTTSWSNQPHPSRDRQSSSRGVRSTGQTRRDSGIPPRPASSSTFFPDNTRSSGPASDFFNSPGGMFANSSPRIYGGKFETINGNLYEHNDNSLNIDSHHTPNIYDDRHWSSPEHPPFTRRKTRKPSSSSKTPRDNRMPPRPRSPYSSKSYDETYLTDEDERQTGYLHGARVYGPITEKTVHGDSRNYKDNSLNIYTKGPPRGQTSSTSRSTRSSSSNAHSRNTAARKQSLNPFAASSSNSGEDSMSSSSHGVFPKSLPPDGFDPYGFNTDDSSQGPDTSSGKAKSSSPAPSGSPDITTGGGSTTRSSSPISSLTSSDDTPGSSSSGSNRSRRGSDASSHSTSLPAPHGVGTSNVGSPSSSTSTAGGKST